MCPGKRSKYKPALFQIKNVIDCLYKDCQNPSLSNMESNTWNSTAIVDLMPLFKVFGGLPEWI